MELAGPTEAARAAESGVQPRSGLSEAEFKTLYERTARPLRSYLYRVTGNLATADDILQETYLRLLQARLPSDMTEEHRRNYLFRIAANLLKSRRRELSVEVKDSASSDNAGESARREDCRRCLAQLTPRQRQLLWLAYVEEFTHKEIASATGLSALSVRPLLSRARQSLLAILEKGGWTSR